VDAIGKRALAQALAGEGGALCESAMVISRVVARDECTLKLPNTRPMRDEEGTVRVDAARVVVEEFTRFR